MPKHRERRLGIRVFCRFSSQLHPLCHEELPKASEALDLIAGHDAVDAGRPADCHASPQGEVQHRRRQVGRRPICLLLHPALRREAGGGRRRLAVSRSCSTVQANRRRRLRDATRDYTEAWLNLKSLGGKTPAGLTSVGRLKNLLNLHARSYLSVKLAHRQYRTLALC
jgi:hypothetical protein